MSFKSKIRNRIDAVVGFCKKHKTGSGLLLLPPEALEEDC